MTHHAPAHDRGHCGHERSHVVDNRFHGGGYGTSESRAVFCDVCRLQRWLDIEVALSASQAELEVIPEQVAQLIAKNADIDLLDLDAIQLGIKETGHSLVPLLRALEALCGGYVGQFIHYGATTQDIQDTGQALEMKEILDLVERDVCAIVERLVGLARKHRDDVILGRTHAQPAIPTTFGLKVAGFIDELLRDLERVRACRERVAVAQLFGGVGTMAGLAHSNGASNGASNGSAGAGAVELLVRFANKLGLAAPSTGWHVSRDRVAEYVSVLAMLDATLARAADEVRTLSRPEFKELEEAWGEKQIGSSTMPHKRNPEGCEQIVVLARLARAQVPVALEAMVLEHERDYRGTRLEWPAVAETSHYTLTALSLMRGIVGGLKVHTDAMAAHAHAAADGVCTEALMLALAACVGKQQAFEIVRRLSQRTQDQKASLRDVARSDPHVISFLSEAQIEKIFEPGHHLGAAGDLVDRVLADAERILPSRSTQTKTTKGENDAASL